MQQHIAKEIKAHINDGVPFEEAYGAVMRADAKASGHKGAMPKAGSVQGRTLEGLRLEIVQALAGREMRVDQVRAKVNAKKTTVQNNLYQMRSMGLVHSIYAGPKVIWRLGPKPREQAA